MVIEVVVTYSASLDIAKSSPASCSSNCGKIKCQLLMCVSLLYCHGYCILYYVIETRMSLPDVITTAHSSKSPLIKVNTMIHYSLCLAGNYVPNVICMLFTRMTTLVLFLS